MAQLPPPCVELWVRVNTDFATVTIALAGRTIPDATDYIIAYREGRRNGTSQRIEDYDYAAHLRRQA